MADQGGDGDRLPGAEDAVAQHQEPAGDVAHGVAEGTVHIFHDAAGNGDGGGEFTEHRPDGHQEQRADAKGDHGGDGTAAGDHPVAHLQHPAGADDGAETDGEEVPQRQGLFHAALFGRCGLRRICHVVFPPCGRVSSPLFRVAEGSIRPVSGLILPAGKAYSGRHASL